MMTISRSDNDSFGFRTDEILAFLSKYGITISDRPNIPSGSVRPNASIEWLDWQTTISYQSQLSFDEAVAAFAGIDPQQEQWVSSNEGQSELARWDRILRTAINTEDLIANDDPSGSIIYPIDLATWCDKKGIARPLPWNFNRPPATDPELQQALEDAQNEATELKKQIQSLTEQVTEMGLGKGYAGILDRNNEFHPPELLAAMRAWRVVTANGNPRLLGKGVTQALTKWLRDHQSEYGLSNKAIERIATVANWNKAGGTPPTPSGTGASLSKP